MEQGNRQSGYQKEEKTMKKEADVILVNGSVITVDPADRVCQGVAISGNKILAAGTSDQMKALAGPETKLIDLKGRSLLPGFIDAHCHAGNYGPVKFNIVCHSDVVRSIEELKGEIRKRTAGTPKGGWILGRGYDNTKLKEKRHPTRWDFDEAAPEHKVFILRTCGHLGVLNSLALKEFGIQKGTPDPHGGRIERDPVGEPTGLLYEQALLPARMGTQPNYEELVRGLKVMNEDFLRYGITSATDASGRNPDEIRAFQRGAVEGWLQVRIYFQVRTSGSAIRLGEHYLQSGLVTGYGNEKLRLGSYKLMLDGAGGGGSAAMREAYPGKSSDFGILHQTQEELDELVLNGQKAGYQIGVHAIGDRAVEMTLQSFARALKKFPRENCRHRIEHCGFLDGSLMEQMRKMGVVAALGLPFLYELGDSYITVFGQDRLQCVYPLRSLMERGIVAGISSDTPVIDPNPLTGIYFAVTRKTFTGQTIAPHEAVSVLQAIRAYTLSGAYASFEEGIKGSIEVGKLADLVVLSRDILKIAPEKILETKVDLTMVDGNVVYESRKTQSAESMARSEKKKRVAGKSGKP
jgi:predicted amidohydrolase YtcJ